MYQHEFILGSGASQQQKPKITLRKVISTKVEHKASQNVLCTPYQKCSVESLTRKQQAVCRSQPAQTSGVESKGNAEGLRNEQHRFIGKISGRVGLETNWNSWEADKRSSQEHWAVLRVFFMAPYGLGN